MKNLKLLEEVKKMRQDVIDTIATTHSNELFGEPPSRSSSGKLTGGKPPNMDLIQKLFS